MNTEGNDTLSYYWEKNHPGRPTVKGVAIVYSEITMLQLMIKLRSAEVDICASR